MMRIIKKLLIAYIVLFAALTACLYFFGNKVLLHPKSLEANHVFRFDMPFEERMLIIDENNSYNIIQFHPADSTSKGVVLYFHGNEKNVERYAPYVKRFTDNGWEIWMVDYPGFGKSTGDLTEEGLYEMSTQLYKMARARFEQQQIIIYGKSFGNGIASYLASVRDCKRLIMETPYYSIPSLVNSYLKIFPIGFAAKFRFPVNEYLKKVDDPITVFHGTDDEVIPYSNAERLKKLLKPNDEFVTIENGKHNALTSFPIMQQKLDSLLR